jgi:polyribonucleotide nucleotidyltransferase
MTKLSEEKRKRVEIPFHGADLSIETGWIAKQAHGSAIVRHGDTIVMATVCGADARPDQSFFPLTVEYRERTYAAGKIPGGFIKREGRPSEGEILVCRLIDRPIRPLFPEGYMDEVQLIVSVLSADENHNPDMLAITAASAALNLSHIPFLEPIAGVRVGRVDGNLVINPSNEQQAKSDINMVVAATKEAIVMVEGGAEFAPESEVLDALYFGHDAIKQLIELQEQLAQQVGVEKSEFVAPEKDAELVAKVEQIVADRLVEAFNIKGKHERHDAVDAIHDDVMTQLEEQYGEEFPAKVTEIKNLLEELDKKTVRSKVIRERIRIDGRQLNEVRPIECEVGLIPRAHGSALFTRGETQGIITTTVGTGTDAQRVESLQGGQTEKQFMLHYNFPPFCTGEVKMLRGTGRREVGHGALAERALLPVVPKGKDFPYVLRIVSDITESNGSSSMASVCGGSLSMMDAGIKTKAPVSGVAMGLIKEGDDVAVLTDILGDEDHFGDMDFKVCGTEEGITALQMDIKCTGLSRETMSQALEQAREARVHILEEMAKAISIPRESLSKYAPLIQTMKINPDKIRDVIGSGGKTIRSIVESTGVKIDIEDDGTVLIASPDQDAAARAIAIIEGLTAEAEVGKVYAGVVKRVVDFGAFVEILPNVEGLVHISQLEHRRVENVSDVVREGDEVKVRVLDIDRQGRIRLSRKEALDED